MSLRDGRHLLGTQATMQNAQPDNMDSIPLRRSSHRVGTIAIRFVGLLTLAVLVMTLIWSR